MHQSKDIIQAENEVVLNNYLMESGNIRVCCNQKGKGQGCIGSSSLPLFLKMQGMPTFQHTKLCHSFLTSTRVDGQITWQSVVFLMNWFMKSSVCFPLPNLWFLFCHLLPCSFIYLRCRGGFWLIFLRPGLNQTGFDHPCSKTGLHSGYGCSPHQVDTAAERHSSAPSLLLCHLLMWAAQGPVSRLQLHN